jgi:hypothetical protein
MLLVRKTAGLIGKTNPWGLSGAEISTVDEYNIFSESGKVAFAALKLKSQSYLPMKVYRELPTDPLSSLTAALAKMQEGEGAVVQICISTADHKWSEAGSHYLIEHQEKRSGSG